MRSLRPPDFAVAWFDRSLASIPVSMVGWQRPQLFQLPLFYFGRGPGCSWRDRTAAFSANVFWFTHEYGFNRGFIHFEDFFDSISDMVFRTLYGRMIEKFVMQGLGFEIFPRASMPLRSTVPFYTGLGVIGRGPSLPS